MQQASEKPLGSIAKAVTKKNKNTNTHALFRTVELAQRILGTIEQNENISQRRLVAKLKAVTTYNTLMLYLSDMQKLLFIERSESLDENSMTRHLKPGFVARYRISHSGREFLRLISGSLTNFDH